MEQEIAIGAGPDYSVWGLVMQADPGVKGVMIVLVLASVACWAIIFEKVVTIWWLKRSIRRLANARDSHSERGRPARFCGRGNSRLILTKMTDQPKNVIALKLPCVRR
jgi:biopolymer transport protein ExbB/TolQ